MVMRRLISLLLSVICLAVLTVIPFAAAQNTEEESVAAVSNRQIQNTLSPQNLGYAEYAKQLDKTIYNGELGAIYTPHATTFRVWSPVASDIKVCIYKTGSDDEPGAKTLSTNPMKYSSRLGSWYLTLKGDYKNMYYTYLVTANGETHEVVDPYAKAVGVNGNRGMIVDLDDTDPEEWDQDSFARVNIGTEAIVWEVSVRDFSASATSGISEPNRGKFLAFAEEDTTLNGKEGDIPTCVSYLKQLGVNYVQINPFYDFASIDEADTETKQYNWGYDPKNYNVPEGSYSSNPYDGRVRIKECKQMIQALHKAGIGVIMDVVYNHTYESQNSFFNQLVPDYYYRIAEDGVWSNGSGCGNDVATERYMVRRFIRDSVLYWAQEYHIDGFRFDLMGLMDTDTMATVRKTLDKLPDGQKILMYGEGWELSTATDVPLATQKNMNLLSKRLGAFNDSGRDAIKGSVFNAGEGAFVQSGSSKAGIKGMIDGDAGGWATLPNQVVNYASCHDNLTLYDKLYSTMYDGEDYASRHEDLVAMNRLSAAIVMTSRGMPFMLAGEEFARSKDGDENSYKSSVDINQLNWQRIKEFPSLVDYYKGLIQIRSTLDVFKDALGRANITYLETDGGECIAYEAQQKGCFSAIVAFNGSASEKSVVSLPDGKWVQIADGERAGLSAIGTFTGKIEVPHTSAAILISEAAFKNIGVKAEEACVFARYINERNDVTVYEQKYTGQIGESYSISVPDEVLFRYNITSSQSVYTGVFENDFDVVDIMCEKYEGNYSTVTFRYVNDFDEMISNSVVITNRVGQQYYSQPIPALPGYVLDLDKLPSNGAGKYTNEPIEVVYHYKPADTIIAPDVSDEYKCRANVIYMSNSGEILDTKTYLGVDGDLIEVEELKFDGYTYHGKSDNYATFSDIEANIIVNYVKKTVNMLPFYVIGGAAVVLLVVGLFYFIGRGRRRKIKAISIDD